jgi:hypothetical protein
MRTRFVDGNKTNQSSGGRRQEEEEEEERERGAKEKEEMKTKRSNRYANRNKNDRTKHIGICVLPLLILWH